MRKTYINSASNYTPMLMQDGSVGSAKAAARFKKRLGTEPFILSEGQIRTNTTGFISNANGESTQATGPINNDNNSYMGSKKNSAQGGLQPGARNPSAGRK